MPNQNTEKRILIATGLYPPEIGGPATYTRMLEEKLPPFGFVLDVVPFGIVRHLPKGIRHVVYAYTLFKKAKEADIVYALDSISVGIPAWFISVLRRKTFMIRLGGDYAWEQGQQRFGLHATLDEYTAHKNKASLPVRVLASIQGFIVRRAQKVIVPSEYMKSIVSTWHVKPDRLQVIYSALFPLEVTQSKESLREQLSYDDFVITTVGRLVPWKGFEAMIEVVAKLNETFPATLIIAGDGPLDEVLKNKITALGVEDKVRMVGRLSKDALGATIKGSDVFVLNTAYEGLSHQLLEVMDIGVPIVTTPVGGNVELVTDSISGLFAEFDNVSELRSAILRIHDNAELKTRLVQNARVRSKDFAQDTVIKDLVTVLRSL